MGWNWPELRERLTMLVIVGMRTEEHSLRNQAGIRSDSDCLLASDVVVVVVVTLRCTSIYRTDDCAGFKSNQ